MSMRGIVRNGGFAAAGALRSGVGAEAQGGLPDYLRPYAEAVDEHGPGFRATLWASPERQRVRFEVLRSMVGFRGLTVLDAGCGTGDLAADLAAHGEAPAAYLGLDALPELVESARRRGLAGARFETADFVRDEGVFDRWSAAMGGADVVVFCGSLNTLEPSDARRAVRRAWRAARRAVVFNFLVQPARAGGLAAWLKPRPARGGSDPALRRHDPAAMVRWAQGATPAVALRSDYLRGQDATLAMFKRDARGSRQRCG
ncbi:MAG: class I SAM-dependent methyltransferase [Phycisphaerales bacterium]|nr:class I SAM-dependent methyltransferase [Phycisphaerales bacterium]